MKSGISLTKIDNEMFRITAINLIIAIIVVKASTVKSTSRKKYFYIIYFFLNKTFKKVTAATGKVYTTIAEISKWMNHR